MTDSNAGGTPWRAVLAGLCAVLVGIGLGRFAYTPLIPALIAAHWFTPSQVLYFGAANLAGYLVGALYGRKLLALAPAHIVLRAAMLVASASFFACAAPVSLAWYFAWRVTSGVIGAVLMVLAAPSVLPLVHPARRGLASGVIITGVGLGIAASGTLVPLLLRWGLAATWCGLGGLSLLITLWAWRAWPAPSRMPRPLAAEAVLPRGRHRMGLVLVALCVSYSLDAVGVVPHMVFLVDFIARGLGRGLAVGAGYWVLFGLGAAVGPMLTGLVADRIGSGLSLRLGLAVQALAVGLTVLVPSVAVLVVSSVVVGALVTGVVSLVLARVQALLPHDVGGQRTAWSYATASFALGLAAAAYGYTFLISRGWDYPAIFTMGAGALGLALVLDLSVALRVRRHAAAAQA